MVRFGGNEFTSFSVPLVFGGRCFVAEPGSPPLVSVVVEQEGEARFEVIKNEPGDAKGVEVSATPVGIVTVSGPKGGFIYKVRPESETSVTFGRVGGEGELEARISDNRTKIVRLLPDGETEDVLTAENNAFVGPMAGIVVEPDGSIGMGAPIPAVVAKAFGL